MVISRLVVKVMLFGFTTLFIGCGESVSKQRELKSATKPQFSIPEIPLAIRGVENRSRYLAEHYWDSYDFGNAELLDNDSLTGITIGGYIHLLAMSAPSVVESSINLALSRSLQLGYDSFERFTSKLENYLYNPNSPMRNEELYIYVLRYTINSAKIEDLHKVRSRSQLELAMKNRSGEIAIDFEFELQGGRKSTMHAIKSKFTILFFNTPDCEDCMRVKDYIANSSVFRKLVRSGELTLLGIYTERDIELWRKSTYPTIIENGADINGVINQKRLYDLKALPTLYLLGDRKRVLLKDCSIEEVEMYIGEF